MKREDDLMTGRQLMLISIAGVLALLALGCVITWAAYQSHLADQRTEQLCIQQGNVWVARECVLVRRS